jgi:hypothetical protein
MKSILRASTYHRTVGFVETPVQGLLFFLGGLSPFSRLLRHAGEYSVPILSSLHIQGPRTHRGGHIFRGRLCFCLTTLYPKASMPPALINDRCLGSERTSFHHIACLSGNLSLFGSYVTHLPKHMSEFSWGGYIMISNLYHVSCITLNIL